MFGHPESAKLRGTVRTNLDTEEELFAQEPETRPPPMKLIRLRLVFFKLNKLLGAFAHLEKGEKLKLVNTIMQTYLWAMHKADLTEVDKSNLDDVIIVAAELLLEIKVWDFSHLNPVTFMLITILEYAIKKSGANNSLRLLLMKVEDRMGLSSKFHGISNQVNAK